MPEKLDEQTMALRVAREFEDGQVVNLGFGIPTLASNFIPEGKEVRFQAENGVFGFGRAAQTEEEQDFHLVNASGQMVTRQPGMVFFEHQESFTMIRGRHIDMCVLGGLQVAVNGDLANWVIPGREPGSVGGAMDLAFGAKKLVVVMTHVTKNDEYKLVNKCSYELTAPRCVDKVITDIAVVSITPKGMRLDEVAPGWTPEMVQELTEPKLIIEGEIPVMAF
ncbi:MAG: 3-oxoacid CoA-transferase subunit B [Dehalococcoidales bacterium]|nr:3-oxoacid CoA-transferase subunit B [Dehalococcoidales bacterium]